MGEESDSIGEKRENKRTCKNEGTRMERLHWSEHVDGIKGLFMDIKGREWKPGV